jgi:hypothetical protein
MPEDGTEENITVVTKPINDSAARGAAGFDPFNERAHDFQKSVYFSQQFDFSEFQVAKFNVLLQLPMRRPPRALPGSRPGTFRVPTATQSVRVSEGHIGFSAARAVYRAQCALSGTGRAFI